MNYSQKSSRKMNSFCSSMWQDFLTINRVSVNLTEGCDLQLPWTTDSVEVVREGGRALESGLLFGA